MTDINDSFEKLRAYNVIWDFSKNYQLAPKNYYPMEINYKNIIEGFKLKTFDSSLINSYLQYLKKDNPFYKEFKLIIFLVLENISYLNLRNNLAIDDLRKKYANEILKKYIYKINPDNIAEQIEKAYYGKIFGETIKEAQLVRDFYKELFEINTKSTTLLLDKLDKIFNKYFIFERFDDDYALFDKMIETGEAQDFSDKDNKVEFKDEFIDEQFQIGSAEFTGNIYFEEKKEDLNKNLIFFNDENSDYIQSNDFIEDFYGKSILSANRQELLEKKVAKGIHKSKRLYFTRGDYTENPNAKFHKKNRDEQTDLNRKYIEKNLAINNRAINDLSRTIKNSIANHQEEELNQKNYGIIDSSRVWRAPVLNDYNVFEKIELDEKAKFKVDLLLDGSASQIERQSIVANQAYIIAEAMDKVNIPIRIISFSTLRDHTVFNIYRDYDEKNDNKNIYSYFASGSNRDGLAFKTLHSIIKEEKNDDIKNIIIVLSDGRPHDEKHSINTINVKIKDQYIDELAVEDTAKEIRNIKKDGISVLGVFTGQDEDVENAKLIYNNDFCRITKLENFSKIVSIFLKNQIMQ